MAEREQLTLLPNGGNQKNFPRPSEFIKELVNSDGCSLSKISAINIFAVADEQKVDFSRFGETEFDAVVSIYPKTPHFCLVRFELFSA